MGFAPAAAGVRPSPSWPAQPLYRKKNDESNDPEAFSSFCRLGLIRIFADINSDRPFWVFFRCRY